MILLVAVYTSGERFLVKQKTGILFRTQAVLTPLHCLQKSAYGNFGDSSASVYVKKNVKQLGLYMPQDIRFSIFYLCQQNKTNEIPEITQNFYTYFCRHQ